MGCGSILLPAPTPLHTSISTFSDKFLKLKMNNTLLCNIERSIRQTSIKIKEIFIFPRIWGM